MNHHEILAKLKDRFTEDIALIEEEEKRISALMKAHEYYLHEDTQRLITLCRHDIIFARKELATKRNLTQEEQDALWHIIDARTWFLDMVVKDFDAELGQMEQELLSELDRVTKA